MTNSRRIAPYLLWLGLAACSSAGVGQHQPAAGGESGTAGGGEGGGAGAGGPGGAAGKPGGPAGSGGVVDSGEPAGEAGTGGSVDSGAVVLPDATGPDLAIAADAPAAEASPGPGVPPEGVVPPIVPDECPGDLTAGFTEYHDTFKVQYPYDLKPEDRYSFANGIYTIWVLMGDKPHEPGNTTRERTEFRWSDISTGTHLWSGDFKVQAGSEHVCIFQVKNSGPPTGVYLRVDKGNLHQLNGSNFLNGIYDKWFNLKVVVDTAAATGKVYINNCLKQTVNMPRGSGTWYFKNGTYTCDSMICKDFWKNIHIYKK
jgi:hypothetical protein